MPQGDEAESQELLEKAASAEDVREGNKRAEQKRAESIRLGVGFHSAKRVRLFESKATRLFSSSIN